MSLPWREYSALLAEIFHCKVQKIAVNAGFSCPNRDGTKGRGGCIYCTNASFNPAYCSATQSVAAQLEEGKRFFAGKYPEMKYLAYFQAYTSTHAAATDRLMTLYRQAAEVPDVAGLVIATRPDCMPDALLDRLAAMPLPVMIEYGAETSHDATLRLINRCHTSADTVSAVRRTHAAGLRVGLHLINGLPGETEPMMEQTVDWLNYLPVSSVKFHHLQILKDTPLSKMPDVQAQCLSFSPESYAALCARLARRLRPDIAIDRFLAQAPPEMVISPRWGLKNYQFTHLVVKQLQQQQSQQP